MGKGLFELSQFVHLVGECLRYGEQNIEHNQLWNKEHVPMCNKYITG